jgi:hypothetical protein
MYRAAISVMLLLTSAVCFAQIKPTPRVMESVSDESMVINDRGSKLEVFLALRAVRKMSTSGKRNAHSEFRARKSAPINAQQLGVVFNHAMQARGYITGEIAFKMKNGLQATDWLDESSYPGLAKLTPPNTYLVVARTPSEFIELTKRLQARTDMEYVEPIVIYGAPGPVPDAQRTP